MAGKSHGNNTVAVVTKIVKPIAEQLGLILWDVRFVKEGASWYLRVFIDKEGGVTLNDCEAMSRAIDQPLDDADPIEQSYCLEVSSPGLERELTREAHLQQYCGQKIKVRLIRPRDGQREFAGVLESAEGKQFTLRLPEGGALLLDLQETSFVKADDFDF